MDQQHSTSKVTVEYFDPHNVYRLITPGLARRLPLRNLHWQSHAGPLRSIGSLHVELVDGAADGTAPSVAARGSEGSTSRDDDFQTQPVTGQQQPQQPAAATTSDFPPLTSTTTASTAAGSQRRHQIPGLRRTPYLKVLLVRCDDNDSYKNVVRAEVRDWLKAHTPPSSASSKKTSKQEQHDAFEWLVLHVVLPNTAAATQPRSTGAKADAAADKSRWRSGSTPLMEKFRSDFNSSAKGSPDRVAQIRIGINDVPYDHLPRVIPAVPSGYSETEQDAEAAWQDLVTKFKGLILSSFDQRVTQYEEDIREKDAQRSLAGWNFCTFFILKEGLARGFESVGLVEDALVGYDELSVGLDAVLREQAATGSPESHGSAMLSYTQELKTAATAATAAAAKADHDGDVETENLQGPDMASGQAGDIAISSTKKTYRDMILANKVSIFDFRCYIFARQVSLLLRLANAWVSRDQLMAKLKDQQESVLQGVVAPENPAGHGQDAENLSMLAEICRRTLEFIPSISQLMRLDMSSALAEDETEHKTGPSAVNSATLGILDNLVASFAFSVTQQILAQTSTKALPIPPTTLAVGDGPGRKGSIPEPKTTMHPARRSSLQAQTARPLPSPGGRAGVSDAENKLLKTGLEELAARRADLYVLSRSMLVGVGKKRGWSDGWDTAPAVDMGDMEDVDLDEEGAPTTAVASLAACDAVAGVEGRVLRTAVDNTADFYRLYEILTDKALRHYAVANHGHAVHACMADLAVLKVHLREYEAAASWFVKTEPFFGEGGWSSLELSMLVMYCRCLGELDSKDDYVTVALKLLSKACAAERERLRQRRSLLRATTTARAAAAADPSPIQGVLGKLFEHARTLRSEVRVPLANFFADVRLSGAPEYLDGRDSFFLTVLLYSLLPERLTVDTARVKVTCLDGGPCRELVLENKEGLVLSPGRNGVTVGCNSVVPGRYRISHFSLALAGNVHVDFDRDAQHAAPKTTDVFRDSDIFLFQRTDALDVGVSAARHVCLDKNNLLEVTVSTGWNRLRSCEVRVRPATGGLRLLTAEAKLAEAAAAEFTRAPEAGAFFFGVMAEKSTTVFRFPYSTEQDVVEVLAKVEVTYVSEAGESFFLAKTLTVPVSLALGVNVQDVFKHKALFSRFNVSTATASPLRLYKSKLVESELFESSFGLAPAGAITIYPKQAASLLYRITRKDGCGPGRRSGRVMHLELHYSVLRDEVEGVVAASVEEALAGEAAVRQYAKLAVREVVGETRKSLQGQDLERAALVGEVTTAFLEGVAWAGRFGGLGTLAGTGEEAATRLGDALTAWQRRHGRLPLAGGAAAATAATAADEARSILIPVEIPSLAVVHTVDIRLQAAGGGPATARVNEVLAATMLLRWTRAWDTDGNAGRRGDREFSYEVTAPGDTWIIGGRRKGHFVIGGGEAASTAATEAAVPLVLVPQREGRLALPSVEVREVVAAAAREGGAEAAAAVAAAACETDWRNLGETVRVVGERRSVTVSLDASGPGGGPLVVESEGLEARARVVA